MAGPRVYDKAAERLKKRRDQLRRKREAAKASTEPIVSVTDSFTNVAVDIEAPNSSVASNVEAADREDTTTVTAPRANSTDRELNHSVATSDMRNNSSQSRHTSQ